MVVLSRLAWHYTIRVREQHGILQAVLLSATLVSVPVEKWLWLTLLITLLTGARILVPTTLMILLAFRVASTLGRLFAARLVPYPAPKLF